jgi:acyl-CoA thioester hydrolase
MIETYRGVVYPNQLDHMGHMNVQWYTSKFDEATWHLFSAIGITSDYIRKNNKGMAALEQTTKYKTEVMAGDLLVVKSEILEVKDKTIRFLHIMHNAENQLEVATTELIAVHLDRKERRACSLPGGIKEKCTELAGDARSI